MITTCSTGRVVINVILRTMKIQVKIFSILTLIQLTSGASLTENASKNNSTTCTTYSNGLIIAQIFRSKQTNNITNCLIYNLERDVDKVVPLISKNEIHHLPVIQMVTLIDDCRRVQMRSSPSLFSSPDLLTYDLIDLIRNFKSGFIPGTNWCGFGTRAKNYFDLGVSGKVDSCCRSHDLCPYQVPPFSSRFGIWNLSIYTKSLCKCDDIFLQCLKEANSPLADIMGHVFFNVFQVNCLELTKKPKAPFKLSIHRVNNLLDKYKIVNNFNVTARETRRNAIKY